MGERASIGIKQYGATDTLWFYTHWRGAGLPQIVCEALEHVYAVNRHDDQPYASRIIFDTLTGCDGGHLGYGIHVGGDVPDSNYEPIILDWSASWDCTPIIIYGENQYTPDEFMRMFADTRDPSVVM